MLLFLWLALAGYALVCLCACCVYWYETLNSPHPRVPSPRPGVLLCIRQFFSTMANYLACLVLHAAGPIVRRKPGQKRSVMRGDRQGDRGLPPVILIHGLYNNAGAWAYVKTVLDRAGYPCSTFDYSSFGVPLPTILDRLEEHVAAVERDHASRPILVGHSLGGLLARLWIKRRNGEARLLGIVTIGTPHGGSKLAAFAPGALGQSIRPDGSLLSLLQDDPYITGIPCTALVSPKDEAVLPAACLLPPDNWTLRLTPPVGHFGMLLSPEVASLLVEELTRFSVARAKDPDS